MKKKIVSILLCVTMVAAMAVGCGSKDGGSDSKSESGDSKDKKYKVGITIQSLSNAYWAGVIGKLEEQLKETTLLHRLARLRTSLHRDVT